jgi:hypothetical protein
MVQGTRTFVNQWSGSHTCSILFDFWSNTVRNFFHNPTSFYSLMAILLYVNQNKILAYILIYTELVKTSFDFQPNRYATIITGILFYFCEEHSKYRFCIYSYRYNEDSSPLVCNTVSLGKQTKALRSSKCQDLLTQWHSTTSQTQQRICESLKSWNVTMPVNADNTSYIICI